MKLSFHGADHNVTGSCHLLQCGAVNILIDCGLYQGSRESNEENSGPFGFDPASINYLLLTHAHLDHCGRIPLLYQRGFRGEIITTAASRELAKLVMLDSAHLHEEDARYWAKKSAKRNLSHHHGNIKPLYTVVDTLNSFDTFGRSATLGATIQLCEGVAVTFYEAGHILGSAGILIETGNAATAKRIFFSGDIGSAGHPLLPEPVVPSGCDAVVMETTYGDRQHKALQPSVQELYQAINATFARGGNVIIPTFSLERAQELLFYLRVGIENNSIPRSAQIYLDSPMAISATEIFERYPDLFTPAIAAMFHSGHDPFHLKNLHFVRDAAESININRVGEGAIIMAGAGMCTGGRVRHHLKNNLWRPESSVVFVGFAARGTLARLIVDGATEVKIFGEEIPVRAQVHTINGFSAHADQPELLAWHKKTGHPGTTFLVHGENETMKKFAALLKHTKVIMPDLNQTFVI